MEQSLQVTPPAAESKLTINSKTHNLSGTTLSGKIMLI
jgi:hypothetical protein